MKYTPTQLQEMASTTLTSTRTNPVATRQLLDTLSRRTGLNQQQCLERIARLALAPEGARA